MSIGGSLQLFSNLARTQFTWGLQIDRFPLYNHNSLVPNDETIVLKFTRLSSDRKKS